MAGPLKTKELFWNLFFQRSNVSTAIKLDGGGALMARPLREELFTYFRSFPTAKKWKNFMNN